VEELEAIQHGGIKTMISDPLSNRRVDKLDGSGQAAVSNARLSVKSVEGKELLRRRGMHIERGIAHILDSGGMRRATLRGQVNLDKRYKIAAATYNLSQLMPHQFGIGTSKQAAASVLRGLFELLLACLEKLSGFFALFVLVPDIQSPFLTPSAHPFRLAPSNHRRPKSVAISTGR
jgi:Transposase DDE domain